jgi:signal transduction histidine kinase
MSGSGVPDLVESTPDDAARLEALRRTFEKFVEASSTLTAAYWKLHARAEAVDVALARANEELKRKVGELDHVTGRLQAILDALPSAVVGVDGEGLVTALNPAAERLLQVSAADAIGRPGAALGVLRGPAAGDAAVEEEVTLSDGRRVWLEHAVTELPDGAGFVEILTDRTAERGLRDRLHLLDKMAALGEMAAGVAHEIRNPLNGVAGFADLILAELREAADPETIRRYASRIREGAAGIGATVTNLLVLGAPERFVPRAVAVDEIVRGAVATWPADRLDVVGPAELLALGEPFLLRSAFANLARNAFEAMGAQGRLAVSWEARGADEVVVRFRDEGPGWDVETRERACLPFFTTKSTGTGLGLAIVQKVVQLHRGRLELGGAPGAGAEVVVILPRAVI